GLGVGDAAVRVRAVPKVGFAAARADLANLAHAAHRPQIVLALPRASLRREPPLEIEDLARAERAGHAILRGAAERSRGGDRRRAVTLPVGLVDHHHAESRVGREAELPGLLEVRLQLLAD